MKQVQYYHSYTEDFVESKKQNASLKKDYKWIHKNCMYRMCSSILFYIVRFFGICYCKLFLRVKVVNRKVMRPYQKTGCFLYGNHTQPVGDVFSPGMVCGRRRYYAVASVANFGVPILGRILPMIGALPVPSSMEGMKSFLTAIHIRFEQKQCIVVYPEAHVWPYCTQIRPFPATSFKFPVECRAPCFTMTTTYQHRKGDKGRKKKPRIVIYVDGPFYPDTEKKGKEQQKKLCSEIYETMVQRSKNSDCTYIQYKEAR